MSERLRTPSELGQVLGGIPERQVLALRRRHGWPCVQLSRKFIRFTDEHVEQIIAKHSQSGVASGVSMTTPVASSGQTKRSASRRRR